MDKDKLVDTINQAGGAAPYICGRAIETLMLENKELKDRLVKALALLEECNAQHESDWCLPDTLALRIEAVLKE